MESAEDLVRQGVITGLTPEKAVRNLIKSLGKGVLKVMSKMGVSTIASYTGAQIFEAIGLSKEIVDEYFVGATSRLGGVGIEIIAQETIRRHHIAYPPGVRFLVLSVCKLVASINGDVKVNLIYSTQKLFLICSIQHAPSDMTSLRDTPKRLMDRAKS